MVEIMKKYGMIYWANGWGAVKNLCEVIDGVIFINKAFTPASVPYDAYGIDPDALPDYSFERNTL